MENGATDAWRRGRAVQALENSVTAEALAKPAPLSARPYPEFVDIVIIGAGLSGIGAAAHIAERCAGKTYAILEARDDLGGTWDLFRYPGIRSDSDMYTLGYRFKPWTNAKAIADGPSIKAYIAETASERGIDRHIRYGHRVVCADWSSSEDRWVLEIDRGGHEVERISCNFLLMCSGYYSYTEGHRPTWAGEEDFLGTIIHPQFWPEAFDYAGKRVIVIGSGATAVTLVPEMARDAAHVTMLQRSPTYVVSRPSVDPIAERLKSLFPARLAYALTRWKNVLLGQFFYRLARSRPAKVKESIISMVRGQLGPDFDVERHFTPRYNPWDQRICAVADADMFKAIRDGRASVVTDTIARFTEGGIELASGEELAADIVVTATGLKLNLLGDIAISIDGRAIDMSKTMNYKGCMFSGIPNFVSVFGYTNASWTLKADLTSEYVCRLINYLDRAGAASVTPRPDGSVAEQPFIDFSSGYVQRFIDKLPKQGSKRPWKVYQNYLLDLVTLRFDKIDDGALEFRTRSATPNRPSVSAEKEAA